MTYTPQTWSNGPEGGTPVNADRLNYLEQGVAGVSADADGKAPLVHTHTAAQITSGTFAAARLPAATETAIGAVERATQAEANTGTDTTRYLSPALLPGAVASQILNNAAVQTAGDSRWGGASNAINPLFNLLGLGMEDPTLDTRVVTVGSSTMAGNNARIPELGVAQRLAYRAGALTVGVLDSVSAAVGSGPMRWWNGAVGGTTSANYLPAARLTAIGRVAPNYVFHMIGSNDFANGVSPTTYRTNVSNALTSIESTTPGAINVLIHQQGRMDRPTPTYPWSDYRDALATLVSANPTRRVLIDVEALAFGKLDLTRGNRWGLVATDNVHLDDEGHILLADTIGRVCGIPSETSLIRPVTVFPAMPASATYSTVGQYSQLWTVPLGLSAYPRLVRVSATVFARSDSATAISELILRSGGEEVGYRFSTNQRDLSYSFTSETVVPQATDFAVTLFVRPHTGPTYISGAPTFSKSSVTVSPA